MGVLKNYRPYNGACYFYMRYRMFDGKTMVKVGITNDLIKRNQECNNGTHRVYYVVINHKYLLLFTRLLYETLASDEVRDYLNKLESDKYYVNVDDHQCILRGVAYYLSFKHYTEGQKESDWYEHEEPLRLMKFLCLCFESMNIEK